MSEQKKVSVFIVAGNEEINIGACLHSVVSWSDDVHVVDSDSTDGTKEVSLRYTPHVVNHSYVDHASQLKWCFENLPFKNEWILFLDADNVVSDELKELIDQMLINDDPAFNGYFCIHKEIFRDKPVLGMKKWWARLVRKGFAEIDNSELVDYGVKIQGRTGYLKGAIIENNLKEKDIDFWIDKHQRFARRMAAEEVLRKSGYLKWAVSGKLFGNSDERRVFLKNAWMNLPLFVRPFIYWFYRYFLTGAFLQGRHGLTFTILQALWFRIICDMKVQEFQWQLKDGTLKIENLLSQFGLKLLEGDVVGRRDQAAGKF
jgi:glycosyltransferase involved in cell wall biosynthesis